MDAETVLLVALVAVAAGGVAATVWAIRLRRRAEQLDRELDETGQRLQRLQRLAALGEMGASFAHTFNDVLTPILGRTQLLSQRLTEPHLREWVSTIERAALQGAQTIKKIQEFIRASRQEAHVPLDLATVVKQGLEALDGRQRAGVRVETRLEAVPPISGDPVGLREVVEHLVMNALQAVASGGSVTVSTGTEDGQAVLTVADTGAGMSAETQARLFEPFFTTRPGAAGLGLCLAQGIVARHGGQIEIESAVGRGTRVRVTLPAEGVGPGAAAAVAPVRRPPRAASGPAPARCLVVDDDPQVREMIRDILANAGHKVVVAVDGADGVERFKEDRTFDLVITDLSMPRMNGLQLARVCKTIKPAVPVVMLTGWGVLLSEDELAQHGVDEVLTKPVRMDQILSTMAAVRGRAAAAAGAGGAS